MLTEHEVRALLHRAAETVDVTPVARPVRARHSRWPAVAAAAAVVMLAGGVAATRFAPDTLDTVGAPGRPASHTASHSPSADQSTGQSCDRTTSSQDDQPTVPPGPVYPTNAAGLTYGSSADGHPDLVAVVGNCGHNGYVRTTSLDEIPPWAPEAGSDVSVPRTVAVYESDGTTQIDTFTIGRGEVTSTGDQPPSAPQGPNGSVLQGEWSLKIAGVQNEDGTQQYDTFRDVALTASVSGDVMRVFDGCRAWSATFTLTNGKFRLVEPFIDDSPGASCTTEQAPLTGILANIRYVTASDHQVLMHLGSYQIVLVLEPT